MKVIDLLNMIANGEKLPNKIKLECVNSINEHNCLYEFNPIEETYVNGDNQLIQNATCFATLLNLEVEIIEENKPKTLNDIRESYGLPRIEDMKIERLQWCNVRGDSTKAQLLELRENIILQFDKINELINYLNKGE